MTAPANAWPRAAVAIDAAELFRKARTLACQVFQQQLLQHIAAAVGAQHGAINTWHPGGHVASVGLGYDLQQMSDDWHAIDGAAQDFLTAQMNTQPLRAAYAGPDDARLMAPHAQPWRAFQHRYDIYHQMGVALRFEGSDTLVHVYVNRGRLAAPYTQADADLLTALAPMLTEAMLVNRLYASVAQGVSLDDDCAAAVVDAHGWILYPNGAFCAAWAALRHAFASNPAPRVPQDWLSPEARTQDALARHGWRLSSVPLDEGTRIELRPLATAGAAGQLTWRQWEIARMYSIGISHKDIGARLGVSPATVRVHLRNIYQRTGVSNRAQLRGLLGQAERFPAAAP